jgi:hypothetical protein
MALPIVRGLSVALSIKPGRLPDVPVTVFVLDRTPRLFEPFMLVTSMIHDEIHDELHASFVEPVPQHNYVLNGTIPWINHTVITDVVSLGVEELH